MNRNGRYQKISSGLADALAKLRDVVAQPQEFDPGTSTRTFVVATNDSVFTILALDVMAEV